MLNIVIFGAPGSGKGTQSELLIEKYGLNHISTGEVLRKEIQDQTELGKIAEFHISKGHLVPDNLIIDMLADVLDSKKRGTGIIFDGFPRTIEQGKALDKILKDRGTDLSIVINLNVEEEELICRLLKRGEISGRSDDNIDTITARLKVYHEQTAPLIDFYKKAGVLVDIPAGGRSIDQISKEINEAVSRVYEKAMAC